VDLAGFVLMAAGLGGLIGSAAGFVTRAPAAERAVYCERWSLLLAVWSLPGFGVLALIQGVW
jgi:hypothetical protein